MAGRALTPAGVIVKWILIPATLVAIGFFAVGARIGALLPGFGGGSVPGTSSAETKPKRYSSPDVRITSNSKNSPRVHVSSQQKPSSRRKRTHAVPGTES